MASTYEALMEEKNRNLRVHGPEYLRKLTHAFNDEIYVAIQMLGEDLKTAWDMNKRVYIIGNGGSAANAIHIANDLHYGIGACGESVPICGLRVEALTANSAIMSCLGNDIGYERIFAHQIKQKAEPGDLLIALSGSGNSKNIVNALAEAEMIGMNTHVILGYSGGQCAKIAKKIIHFKVNDMQIAEDCQLIVSHMCMQWLSQNKPRSESNGGKR